MVVQSTDCGQYTGTPRSCPTCPSWVSPNLPPELLGRQVVIPQWGNTWDPRKGKDVHALHPKVFTVGKALEELGKQVEKMLAHLVKMATQWEALRRAKASVEPYHLIYEIDYQVLACSSPLHDAPPPCTLLISTALHCSFQVHLLCSSPLLLILLLFTAPCTISHRQMNVTARPFSTTTGSHMTANVRQEALVPVVAYVVLTPGSKPILLGWLFVSDDLKHDYEQVGLK